MAGAPAAAARPKLSKVGSFSKVPTFSLRKVPSFGKADKAADKEKEKEKESPTQAGAASRRAQSPRHKLACR